MAEEAMADMLPLCRSYDDYGRIVFTLFWGGGLPAERPPKTLPPCKNYRPSGYRAIQRLYSERNLNRRRKRETRNQKTDLPRKVYPAIRVSELNPSLSTYPHHFSFQLRLGTVEYAVLVIRSLSQSRERSIAMYSKLLISQRILRIQPF